MTAIKPTVVVNGGEVRKPTTTTQVVNGQRHTESAVPAPVQVVNGKLVRGEADRPAESVVNGVTYREA